MSPRRESPPPPAASGGEIMLFGVRVQVDPMRKSVSLNNLSEYVPADNNAANPIGKELMDSAAEGGATAGYASADDAIPTPPNAGAGRKRGVPWTEDEHKLFLVGLQKVGKGDWRGISRNYVKTRTPTQVASHAQKYFLRRSNLNRRRRRSSLFDITTDSVNAMPTEEVKSQEDLVTNQSYILLPVTSDINGFPIMSSHMNVFPQSGNQVPIFPPSGMVDFNLNHQAQPLSLRLSLSTNDATFQVKKPRFGNGDSVVSVA